jgi:hypothetical protein
MHVTCDAHRVDDPAALAPDRRRSDRDQPLFFADWLHVLFIHYEIDPATIRRHVPFEVDLRNGRAFLSVVAFRMRGLRPRPGGRIGAWLFKPISTHPFLNLRAYVRHGEETGIQFIAEWLSNPLSVLLGPISYGLPYRRGRLKYQHAQEHGSIHGEIAVAPAGGRFSYRARFDSTDEFAPAQSGSPTEHLLERYTAFTCHRGIRRCFSVWHEPWRQVEARVDALDDSLLRQTVPWFAASRLIGAHYSPGVTGVGMGPPHRIGS